MPLSIEFINCAQSIARKYDHEERHTMFSVGCILVKLFSDKCAVFLVMRSLKWLRIR